MTTIKKTRVAFVPTASSVHKEEGESFGGDTKLKGVAPGDNGEWHGYVMHGIGNEGGEGGNGPSASL